MGVLMTTNCMVMGREAGELMTTNCMVMGWRGECTDDYKLYGYVVER